MKADEKTLTDQRLRLWSHLQLLAFDDEVDYNMVADRCTKALHVDLERIDFLLLRLEKDGWIKMKSTGTVEKPKQTITLKGVKR